MVIDHGAVPIFVKLLQSPSDDVREQVNMHMIIARFALFVWNSDYCLEHYFLKIENQLT